MIISSFPRPRASQSSLGRRRPRGSRDERREGPLQLDHPLLQPRHRVVSKSLHRLVQSLHPGHGVHPEPLVRHPLVPLVVLGDQVGQDTLEVLREEARLRLNREVPTRESVPLKRERHGLEGATDGEGVVNGPHVALEPRVGRGRDGSGGVHGSGHVERLGGVPVRSGDGHLPGGDDVPAGGGDGELRPGSDGEIAARVKSRGDRGGVERRQVARRDLVRERDRAGAAEARQGDDVGVAVDANLVVGEPHRLHVHVTPSRLPRDRHWPRAA
mmetsp:Transcript_7943/g.31454  ORF Transcript_7943/g.31454 Transcript_7943/m.31454 type:complete len:271 (-) Transcript_7943:23-835(-)